MVRTPFVPDRGDVIWLQFNPQAGHEQAGLTTTRSGYFPSII